MLLNLGDGKTVNIYFVNKNMLDVFDGSILSIDKLPKLTTYHDKLSPNELGNILRLESLACKKITNKALTAENLLSDVTDKLQLGLITNAFNSVDSKALLNQLNQSNSFYVKGVANDSFVILLSNDDESELIDWTKLSAKKFSTALLEAIFTKVGYLDAHFRDQTKCTASDVTLGDVYKLMNIEL